MTTERGANNKQTDSKNAAYRVTDNVQQRAREFNVEGAIDAALDKLIEQGSRDDASRWDFIPHSDYAFVSVTDDYRVRVGDSRGWGRSLSLDEAIAAATALVHAVCEARDRAQE